jgi:mercuric ion transport protein
MLSPVSKSLWAAAGGVVASIGSALCCGGPLVAVMLGLSGAGLAALEPLRPYFVAGAALALGSGFVVLRREEQRACVRGSTCASPRALRRMKWAMWLITTIAALIIAFPWWSGLVLA